MLDNHFPCNCRVLFLIESPLARAKNSGGGEKKGDKPSASEFMRSNKCISPLNLNGRSMADMKRRGLLAQCKKTREAMVKEQEREEEERRRKKKQAEREAEKRRSRQKKVEAASKQQRERYAYKNA